MNVEEYQELALRTEAKLGNLQGIGKLQGNLPLLKQTLNIITIACEILDGSKKAIAYNDNRKLDKLSDDESIKKLPFYARELLETLENNEVTPYDIDVNYRVLHGIIGICTEAGELAEPLLKALNDGKPFDKVNIHEEMHDISWYMAILHDCLDLSWADGLENNIEKLKIRFPEKYSDLNASNRDLQSEREKLEVNSD